MQNLHYISNVFIDMIMQCIGLYAYIYIYIYEHTRTHTHTHVCLSIYVSAYIYTQKVESIVWVYVSQEDCK